MAIDTQPMNVYWGGKRTGIIKNYKIENKGSVDTFSDLPSSDNSIGGMYTVTETEKNYVWNGLTWDEVDFDIYDFNNIINTPDFALNNEVVHKTGNETIAGEKKFTWDTHFRRGTPIVSLEGTNSSSYQLIKFVDASGSTDVDEAGIRHATNGDLQIGNKLSGESYWYRGPMLQLKSDGSFSLRSYTGTNIELIGTGAGSLSWNGQSLQTSSDERLKTTLTTVPDAVLDAWEDVQWGQFRFLDAVERKGDSSRLHLGLIAQRVKSVFEERGLDACQYGILCHEVREAAGEDPAVDIWMVRYEEALAMEAACQRRRANRLEARIVALEALMGGVGQ